MRFRFRYHSRPPILPEPFPAQQPGRLADEESMNRLTILTHNVFWFQGAAFPTDKPGKPRANVLEGLARLYRAVAADVLCFQEIQHEHAFDLLGQALGLAGHYTPGGTLSQYGGATFWREGACRRDSLGCRPSPQRMWQLVDARPGRSEAVCLCNVHLPSSRQLGPAAGTRRLEELACIIEAKPRPTIILGDLNEMPGGPVSEYLASMGYCDAAAMTGQTFRPSGLGDGRGDYVWVHSSLAERVIEYGVLPKERMIAAPAGEEFLSDHLPLWLTLEM